MADRRVGRARRLHALRGEIVSCQRCPELRAYCAEVASTKRRAYIDWDYWGGPVPAFGDEHAKIMIVGLAPAAHGANRTGRMFTGDRSGDFLYAALHRAGLASQATSTDREDGLVLHGVYITAALRCAPPKNKPTSGQRANCASYLADEFRLLRPLVTLCLGGIAFNAVLGVLQAAGEEIGRPRPAFVHGGEVAIGSTTLLGCYHVSQQNTFTGRLTEPMIDGVLKRAKALAGLSHR
jgi:uracil-DNA glycosylase family 4